MYFGMFQLNNISSYYYSKFSFPRMNSQKHLPLSLLLIRLSVFLVMVMWTLDKFIRPDHASTVYEHFYFIGDLGNGAMYAIGITELLVLIGFVIGFQKKCTYGLVLLFHAVSTLSAAKLYFTPYADGPNLLFFAAWPMLAACLALFLLRDQDTILTVKKRTGTTDYATGTGD